MTPRYEARRRVTRRRGIATSRMTVGAWVRDVGVVSADAKYPTSARSDCAPSSGPIRSAAQAAQQSTVAQQLGVGSLNAEPPDLGVIRLNAEVWTL